jgi:hypothetical protein
MPAGPIAGVVRVVGVDQSECCAEGGVQRRGPGFALFGHTARDHDRSDHQGDDAPRPSVPIGGITVEHAGNPVYRWSQWSFLVTPR